MGRPNFFIIGAPKCGTTSLVSWLSCHPQVYFSAWKEPRYFDTDLKTRLRTSNADYLALFKSAGEGHLAVGEATVWYLFSRDAVPRIERELPGSRYIVMVRNPVDMAYALHEQMLVNQAEHIADFERAWRLSPQRRHGQATSRWAPEPRLLDYQRMCMLGDQVERLLSVVENERILFLVLDDLRFSPRAGYLSALGFLGVQDDGRDLFPIQNPAKTYRSRTIQQVLTIALKGERGARSILGLPPTNARLTRTLSRWNETRRPRPALPAHIREDMSSFFADDIAKLGRLLGRDFSGWLGGEHPETPTGRADGG